MRSTTLKKTKRFRHIWHISYPSTDRVKKIRRVYHGEKSSESFTQFSPGACKKLFAWKPRNGPRMSPDDHRTSQKKKGNCWYRATHLVLSKRRFCAIERQEISNGAEQVRVYHSMLQLSWWQQLRYSLPPSTSPDVGRTKFRVSTINININSNDAELGREQYPLAARGGGKLTRNTCFTVWLALLHTCSRYLL